MIICAFVPSFQHEADSSDMLHEVAADFVCNSLYTSEVGVEFFILNQYGLISSFS